MMRFFVPYLFVALVVGQAVEVARAAPPDEAKQKQITELVQKLGHSRFAQRELACKELEVVGELALEQLWAATSVSKDLEISTRAGQVLRKIMQANRKSKSIGLEMVVVDVGNFYMGSSPIEQDRRADELQHVVSITKPFLLGTYEVTQEEFDKVMKFNPSWFSPKNGGKATIVGIDTLRFPVEQVTWFDAVEFCNRLSKLDGYAPFYKIEEVKREDETIKSATVTFRKGNGYRLPTEAEWEFACRAWSTSRYHYGTENYDGKRGNMKPGTAIGYGSAPSWRALGRTTKVGSYPPNLLGLYDMHGNVAEWCSDWYGKDYYAVSPKADPTGPETGVQRALRGGSWLVNEGNCRSASRFWLTPDENKTYSGFRVARSP